MECVLSFDAVTQEFGTLPGVLVLDALRQENFYHGGGCPVDHWAKRAVLDAFHPPEGEWEGTVVARGTWLLNATIDYIKNIK